MECIVCENETDRPMWCGACATKALDRSVTQWVKWTERAELLAGVMHLVVEKLEELPDDALGMAYEGENEWPLKKELELRLKNALEEAKL